jgi:biopolymer transport protein ExbB
MQSRLFRIAAASILFLAMSLGWGAADYSAWVHSADVVLNTTSAGAGIASKVTGFPLLVRLTPDNFDFAQARQDGADIRFAKSDGSPLPYEIERWDAKIRAAEVWVKVDTILGNDAAQAIRMYWGNDAAADSSKGTAVFGAANGYLAAWHLGGNGTGARPNAAGGNPAQPGNYDGDEAGAGVIAGADSLDGGAAGDYLDLGDGYAELANGMTFTVWAFPTAVKTWSHLLDLSWGVGIPPPGSASSITRERTDPLSTLPGSSCRTNGKCWG